METWSSWLADVGKLSTLDGCANALFSLANAAAVTCAIIKPEFTPPLLTKNGGNWDMCVSINIAIRRSDNAPISANASAILSDAIATGSAWKLPPEIMSPLSVNTSGLSDTALDSIKITSAAWRICVKHAPITWGWQRNEYGSWTFEQFAWDWDSSLVGDNTSRNSAATSIWPFWPRTSWTRASNGLREPNVASTLNAPHTMPDNSRFSAANKPFNANAVEVCVPFNSAKPSLASRVNGFKPAFSNAFFAGSHWPSKRACPSPIRIKLICASGAKSPDAPTDPFAGIYG